MPLLQPPWQPNQGPPYVGAQPGMYPVDMQATLLHYQAMQPAEHFRAPYYPNTVAAAALPPGVKLEASSSDSQQAESSGAKIDLPAPAQPDKPAHPPHVRRKVSQTHRTAQKRYRERQKVDAWHGRGVW